MSQNLLKPLVAEIISTFGLCFVGIPVIRHSFHLLSIALAQGVSLENRGERSGVFVAS